MTDEFELVFGSVIGRDHREAGQNCQDAFRVHSDRECVVAVVCDGCHGGEHSEVGAKIAARIIARRASELLARFVAVNPPQVIAEHVARQSLPILARLKQDVLADLRVLSNVMDDSLSVVTADYFLFTTVGAILCPAGAWFFSLGDGWLVVNGERIALGPFPGNAPPYLSYGNTGSTLESGGGVALDFKVQRALPIKELQSFLIGSDGLDYFDKAAERSHPGTARLVGPLSQFWSEDAYFANPDSVRRKLTLVNRDVRRVNWSEGRAENHLGRLDDDVALIAGRRKAGGGP